MRRTAGVRTDKNVISQLALIVKVLYIDEGRNVGERIKYISNINYYREQPYLQSGVGS